MTEIIDISLNNGKTLLLIEKEDSETEAEAIARYIREHEGVI